VKGATLIGNGPDALTRVSMIGNDLALDSGIGTCGKEGQSVPVGRWPAHLENRGPHGRGYCLTHFLPDGSPSRRRSPTAR